MFHVNTFLFHGTDWHMMRPAVAKMLHKHVKIALEAQLLCKIVAIQPGLLISR